MGNPLKLNKIQKLAEEYASLMGRTLEHGVKPTPVNTERAAQIAQAYDSMAHAPNDPNVKQAYDALINETTDQFKKIKDSGLKYDKITPDMQNPYKSSQDLMKDLHENNHMYYYPTESGFGSGGQAPDHPLLKTVDIDGEQMPANDIFRIVHDYMGHGKEGYQFGPKGEEAAWRQHMQMYSPEAQKALTTETRGQNSWVNYGPNGEANRANPSETKYADQKAGILPDWAFNKNVLAGGAALGAGALGSGRTYAQPIPNDVNAGKDAVNIYNKYVEEPRKQLSSAVSSRLANITTPQGMPDRSKIVDANTDALNVAGDTASDPFSYMEGPAGLAFPLLRDSLMNKKLP